MPESLPLVTVLIPVFNGSAYLHAALASVAAQSITNFICLILNDGSTDSTSAIADHFCRTDPRFQAIHLPNRGLVSTLNTGIDMTRTDWIARLDADDLMAETRLERQFAFVANNAGLDIAASFVRYIDENGSVFGEGRSRFTTHMAVQTALKEGDLIGLHHPSVLARTNSLREMGGYREEARLAEDTDLWTRMAERGMKILVQPEFLTFYRIHGQSVSRAKMEMQNQVVAWLKLCLSCRQNHRPELTLAEFLEFLDKQPLHVKLDRLRRSKAKCFYKDATLSFSKGNYFSFASRMIASLFLQPSHAIKQFRTKAIAKR